MSVSQDDRDRAARLGRLAAKAGRGLGGACPYRPGQGPRQRILAAVFTRAYFGAGGTLDGIDYGDGKPTAGSSSSSTRTSSTRTTRPAAGDRAGRAYGHLY